MAEDRKSLEQAIRRLADWRKKMKEAAEKAKEEKEAGGK